MIDFCSTLNDALAYDLGIRLTACCPRRTGVSRPKRERLCTPRESVRPLEAAEAEALPARFQGTVKNYRRRIYDKLDVTTEREVFLSCMVERERSRSRPG